MVFHLVLIIVELDALPPKAEVKREFAEVSCESGKGGICILLALVHRRGDVGAYITIQNIVLLMVEGVTVLSSDVHLAC